MSTIAPTLSPRNRIPLSVAREVRRTYGVGATYRPNLWAGGKRYVHTAYVTPLILAIEEFPVNQWGDTVTVEIEYAAEGYRTLQGGHFDADAGVWRWRCYMD